MEDAASFTVYISPALMVICGVALLAFMIRRIIAFFTGH